MCPIFDDDPCLRRWFPLCRRKTSLNHTHKPCEKTQTTTRMAKQNAAARRRGRGRRGRRKFWARASRPMRGVSRACPFLSALSRWCWAPSRSDLPGPYRRLLSAHPPQLPLYLSLPGHNRSKFFTYSLIGLTCNLRLIVRHLMFPVFTRWRPLNHGTLGRLVAFQFSHCIKMLFTSF